MDAVDLTFEVLAASTTRSHFDLLQALTQSGQGAVQLTLYLQGKRTRTHFASGVDYFSLNCSLPSSEIMHIQCPTLFLPDRSILGSGAFADLEVELISESSSVLRPSKMKLQILHLHHIDQARTVSSLQMRQVNRTLTVAARLPSLPQNEEATRLLEQWLLSNLFLFVEPEGDPELRLHVQIRNLTIERSPSVSSTSGFIIRVDYELSLRDMVALVRSSRKALGKEPISLQYRHRFSSSPELLLVQDAPNLSELFLRRLRLTNGTVAEGRLTMSISLPVDPEDLRSVRA